MPVVTCADASAGTAQQQTSNNRPRSDPSLIGFLSQPPTSTLRLIRPTIRPLNSGFLDKLAGAVGSAGLLRDPAELITYESDALTHLRATPGAVVLPTSTAEVQAVVRLCHEHRVPFVARGHGTGLSGGALPAPDGVLIVLSRLNRVLEI